MGTLLKTLGDLLLVLGAPWVQQTKKLDETVRSRREVFIPWGHLSVIFLYLSTKTRACRELGRGPCFFSALGRFPDLRTLDPLELA